jgi:DNA-directed RNA polymerase I, II, and III subunit RPABC1
MEIEIARYNIMEMLELRGDDVSYILEHGDAVDVQRYYNERIVLDTDNTTVIFALNKDVLKEWKQLEETPEQMIEKYKTKNFILVMIDQPSSAVLAYITMRDKGLQTLGGMLQIFYVSQLMYNPTKHVLVPKHKKLTEAEKKQVLEKYNTKNTQLPAIMKTDVIARWLGLRHGDVVQITRNNTTSGECYYYRTCV